MPHRALASWAVRMVDATEATMPEVITDGLRELGVALGAVRALYFGFRDGDTRAVVELDWAAPGLGSAVGADYSEAEAGDLFALLRAGEIIACAVDGDDPGLQGLRDILEAEQLACDLIIPLVEDGRLLRAIVMDFAEPPVLRIDELRGLGEGIRSLLAAGEGRVRHDRERQARERALHHKQKLQSLGTMAGGILHDVNNVFQVVLGLAELLYDEPPPERLHSIADDIAAYVSRGAGLSHRILAFSRQDHRAGETLQVSEVIGGIEQILRSTVPADRQLQVCIEPGLGPVYMPRVELEQALVNLCNNAVDATGPGDSITISAEQGLDPSQLSLSVRDTGIGMSDAERGRATEAFFTTKPEGAGTGLGLAMVQGAVEAAGGSVRIESTPGRGTSVIMQLPVGEGPAREAPLVTGEVRGDETILLVEDDAMVLRVTASNLRRHGYTVITARDGAEALRQVRQAQPGGIDLVVTDVVLPKIGGVELYEGMAAAGSAPPFLFTTGYDAGRLSEHLAHGPGRGLLLKPYARTVLLRRVRALLDAGEG